MDIVALSGRKKNKLIHFVKNLEDVPVKKLKFPMVWSQKIDGVYCMAARLPYGVLIFSRTGEIYTSMKHIEDELFKVMVVGQIIIFEACSVHTRDQSVVSGWARDTKNQHPELMAACHDLIYTCDLQGKGDTGFMERWESLRWQLEHVDKKIVTLVHQQYVQSLEEAMTLVKLVWAHGGEGCVLRNPDAPWQGGARNEDAIKIKESVSYDLEVIGYYGGKGKYAGTLGGLSCKWKDGSTIKISGMTDEQRHQWFNKPSDIVGKIVQVDAMRDSSKGKLREPRFKGIRHDKTEGDF